MFQSPWDPLGDAMFDFYHGETSVSIRIVSDLDGPVDEPVATFFREPDQFNPIEQTALLNCRGRILDIGAGSGCHVLALQEMGRDVSALDIMPKAVEIMHSRGIRNVLLGDIYTFDPAESGTFDTLLMLMNGIGIAGTLKGLRRFLLRAGKFLNPGGCLIFDSNDLRLGITKAEIGARLEAGSRTYFGEVEYQMIYNRQPGQAYWWLYIDPDTLDEIAGKTGWHVETIWPGEHGHYLAMLVRK